MDESNDIADGKYYIKDEKDFVEFINAAKSFLMLDI